MTLTITIPTPKNIKPIAAIKTRRYEKMIRKSQEKLAETTLVPGYTNVYA